MKLSLSKSLLVVLSSMALTTNAKTNLSQQRAMSVQSINLDGASLTNPIDITSMLYGGDVTNSTENWTLDYSSTSSFVNLNRNTWSDEGTKDGTGFVIPFIENKLSLDHSLPDLIFHTDTVNVKPGAYKITANVCLYNENKSETSIHGAYLFGNYQQKEIVDQSKNIRSTLSDGKEGYFKYNSILGYYVPNAEIYAIVSKDSIFTFGIRTKGANYNWQALKNVKIYYLGDSNEAVTTARNTGICDMGINDTVLVSISIKEKNDAYINTYKTSKSAEEIMQAISQYKSFQSEVTANITAWEKYKSNYNQGRILIEKYQNNNSQSVFDLADLLDLADEEFDEKNLSTEEIIRYSNELKDAINNLPIGPHPEPEIITNHDFADGWKGWEHSGGTGGNFIAISDKKCAEAWNSRDFNVYQDIKDLPAGIYKLSAKGFYRYLRSDNAWYEYFDESTSSKKTENISQYIKYCPVQLYFNGCSVPFNNAFDYSKKYEEVEFNNVDYYIDQQKQYVYPNTLNTAKEYFSDGYYPLEIYGVVAHKGDSIRIGVKGCTTQGEDSWAAFSDFNLSYHGYNFNIEQTLLEKGINEFNYKDSLIGSDVREYADSVMKVVKEAITSDNKNIRFEAIAHLYDAMSRENESEVLFRDLCDLYYRLEEYVNLAYKEGSKVSASKEENNILTYYEKLMSDIYPIITKKETCTDAKAKELIEAGNIELPLSISSITAGTSTLAPQYFNASGAKLSTLQHGINFVRTIDANGKIKVSKKLVK